MFVNINLLELFEDSMSRALTKIILTVQQYRTTVVPLSTLNLLPPFCLRLYNFSERLLLLIDDLLVYFFRFHLIVPLRYGC